MSKIHEVDRNFYVESKLDLKDVEYYNVKENPWCLYGLLIDDIFRRMPKEVAEKVNDGVLSLHSNTSGGRLRFITDSPYVAIVAKMPDKVNFPHMPQTGVSGFDMYVDNRFHSAFIPSIDMEDSLGSVSSFEILGDKNITINFPLYNNVSDLYIGLKKGSSFKKAIDYKSKEKIVYYGSSITQGGCVSRPGIAYSAIISNDIGSDYINLGFSGSALAEDSIIDYISQMDMQMLVFDYDHNAPTPEYLEKTHYKALEKIRSVQKDIPIFILTRPNISSGVEEVESRRNIIYKSYETLCSNGDQNVYFVDGGKAFHSLNKNMMTIDGIHPNDFGFYCIAAQLEAAMR